jgi:ABC-type transporter Mla subunit MlaD
MFWINTFFISIIFLLAIYDLIKKKDLKSQIVSVGVLGTFVGIFLGLQAFNPEDMKSSISTILAGLKVAFLTSIVGMATAIALSVWQKIFNKHLDDQDSEERVLLEISEKLDALSILRSLPTALDQQDTIREIQNVQQSVESHQPVLTSLISAIERLNTTTKEEQERIHNSVVEGTKAITTALDDHHITHKSLVDQSRVITHTLDELKTTSNDQNEKLISIMNENFTQMNRSLEVAIEELSKGATKEIINALKEVIEEFNNELQEQFGENFMHLNEATINLLQWQENYKSHIEELEDRLTLSVTSIEHAKESLETIAKRNESVVEVYTKVGDMITTQDAQAQELNRHLQTYSHLSDDAHTMFDVISQNIEATQASFKTLAKTIEQTNEKEAKAFVVKTDLVIDEFEKLFASIEQNKAVITLITEHFKELGETIPNALAISLEELNLGLTSLTSQFQRDYKKVMDGYRRGF